MCNECLCPMAELYAKAAKERDELRAKNRKLVEQKERLINELMNRKLREGKGRGRETRTVIVEEWRKEN